MRHLFLPLALLTLTGCTQSSQGWQTTHIGRHPSSVCITPDNQIWAAGSNEFAHGAITSITEYIPDPQGKFRDLVFLTPDIGLAVGDSATVVRTEDGGKNWKVLEAVRDSDDTLYALSCPSGNVFAGGGKTLLRSQNQGKVWDRIPMRGLSDLRSLAFANAGLGFALSQEGQFFRSLDGGRNWDLVTLPQGTPPMRCLYLTDAQNLWLAGDQGHTLRTSDGGKTWTASQLPQPLTAVALQSQGSRVFLATKDTGNTATTVFESSDSGATWKEAIRTVEFIASDLASSPGQVWIVGEPLGSVNALMRTLP